jgi:hypothetical protein
MGFRPQLSLHVKREIRGSEETHPIAIPEFTGCCGTTFIVGPGVAFVAARVNGRLLGGTWVTAHTAPVIYLFLFCFEVSGKAGVNVSKLMRKCGPDRRLRSSARRARDRYRLGPRPVISRWV